ncbi:RNA polymerase sigma-70 factor [Hyphobacterium sp. CCMP332]|nr:RNA polymerase sigma-70 factor [Hyphobacterium sp. CCMP332]
MDNNNRSGSNFDKTEFENLFNENYESVRNFIYYKTGDIQLAEDICQDVFIKVWERRSEIIPEKVKYLCFTIANNLSLNYLKHLKIVYNFKNAFIERHEFESPEHLLIQKEFDLKLQEVISELPEKQRIVFLMNRIDKLTYNEIADRLGLSVKAIEKRMSQALKELNTKLQVKV